MIFDANGSHKRTIPLPDATLNLGPGAWSPNGARIAFEGWDETNPGRNGESASEIPSVGQRRPL
jgi:hypothetical protein